MKKLSVLFALLFLVACSGIEGESVTRCEDGAVVTIIEGYDDAIVRWSVRTTRERAEFDQEFAPDDHLSEDDFIELFAYYNDEGIQGISVGIIELNSEYVVIEVVYDYTVISNTHLSRMWGVDDFEDSITLSMAIAGFEENDIVCEMVNMDDEENGTEYN